MGGRQREHLHRGFTLIELSIVLVIIGLLVGGVLVGQNLIGAAAVRATLTQVEKYNTAANTFFGKYQALPGDLNAQVASQFGFASRGPNVGEGDGNGLIQGIFSNVNGNAGGNNFGAGETMMFWVDLTQARLIDGNFSASSSTALQTVSSSSLAQYLPAAKLGQGNYVYAASTWYAIPSIGYYSDGRNYFGLLAISSIGGTYYNFNSTPGLTVQQAYAMDTKVDDGLPQSGNVSASYATPLVTGWIGLTSQSNSPDTSATAGSAMTCFDNNNVGGAMQKYSLEISGGSNVSCALSFRMQAGD